MLRLLLAAFVLAHGLIHVSFLTPAPAPAAGGPPWPFNLDRSWLLTRMGVSTATAERVGRTLVALTAVGFAVAAAGLATGASWWGPAAVAASLVSLVQLTAWFHWWLPVGLLIDIGVIAAVLGRWPTLTGLGG
jgi:hypothetical protein